jgi:hypothetical protein
MKRIAAGLAGLAMAAGAAVATTAPAQAAPLVTGGLVNVTVTEVIDDVTVTVQDVNVGVNAALALAANVCGTTVGVIAQDLASDGTCTNDQTGQTATITQR